MSLTLYDTAITEKIKSWVQDTEATIMSPDDTTQLLRIKADKLHDRPIQLPLITIKRERTATLREPINQRKTREGKVFNSDGKISDHLNAIPITIDYSINIYTRTMEEADEYVRNFVFYIINYPKIRVLIPYNDSPLAYISYMTLVDTITDNSDIPERIIAGMFYRMTIQVSLTDAYLFSYNHRNVPKIVSVTVDFSDKSLDETVPTVRQQPKKPKKRRQ